jgi:hypothetical protein
MMEATGRIGKLLKGVDAMSPEEYLEVVKDCDVLHENLRQIVSKAYAAAKKYQPVGLRPLEAGDVGRAGIVLWGKNYNSKGYYWSVVDRAMGEDSYESDGCIMSYDGKMVETKKE